MGGSQLANRVRTASNRPTVDALRARILQFLQDDGEVGCSDETTHAKASLLRPMQLPDAAAGMKGTCLL